MYEPCKKTIDKSQISLKEFVVPTQKRAQKSEPEYTQLAALNKKTRPFPQFPLDELEDLNVWLQGVEGKNRTSATAREICVDVSKLLRFHSSLFCWDRLLDENKTKDYLSYCQEAGVQADGLVTKCERVITTLNFLKLQKTRKDDFARRAEIDATIDRISTWKANWRKEKGKVRVADMEDEAINVEDLTAILRHDEMWEDFDRLVDVVNRNEVVDASDIKLITAMMAVVLLLESVQRPGAVINCTLQEYKNATYMPREKVWIISVQQHKTSRQGPARLTISDAQRDRLDLYVSLFRALCDPFDDQEQLLLLPEGKRIVKLGPLLKMLEDHYQVKIPTSTAYRKAVATKAALQCSSGEITLLSNQMSHTVQTHKKNYEKIGTKAHAAEAYALTKRLSIPKRSRIPFQQSEIKNIMAWFSKEIRDGTNATLPDCRKYLNHNPNPHDRSDKNIQDKVKHLATSLNKD